MQPDETKVYLEVNQFSDDPEDYSYNHPEYVIHDGISDHHYLLIDGGLVTADRFDGHLNRWYSAMEGQLIHPEILKSFHDGSKKRLGDRYEELLAMFSSKRVKKSAYMRFVEQRISYLTYHLQEIRDMSAKYIETLID